MRLADPLGKLQLLTSEAATQWLNEPMIQFTVSAALADWASELEVPLMVMV